MKVIDIAGQRFGRLIVVKYVGGSKWLCICDCGQEHVARAAHMKAGRIKSCGCLQQEARVKHGLRNTLEYAVWAAMHQRCSNIKHPEYHRYGGRGIKVCERWSRFENFYADMGPRPAAHLSLDRINNDGDYEPSNCRWATALEQANNNRTVRRFEGKTVGEWARELGVTPNVIRQRLHRYNTVYSQRQQREARSD